MRYRRLKVERERKKPIPVVVLKETKEEGSVMEQTELGEMSFGCEEEF